MLLFLITNVPATSIRPFVIIPALNMFHSKENCIPPKTIVEICCGDAITDNTEIL